mmetsp:Transcript_1209/g.2947  ORF Transcript_1209/g.2947 Transcript_1209/m.2947 type:complete len:270 (-) Transcript_1209:1203-2012(-)
MLARDRQCQWCPLLKFPTQNSLVENAGRVLAVPCLSVLPIALPGIAPRRVQLGVDVGIGSLFLLRCVPRSLGALQGQGTSLLIHIKVGLQPGPGCPVISKGILPGVRALRYALGNGNCLPESSCIRLGEHVSIGRDIVEAAKPALPHAFEAAGQHTDVSSTIAEPHLFLHPHEDGLFVGKGLHACQGRSPKGLRPIRESYHVVIIHLEEVPDPYVHPDRHKEIRWISCCALTSGRSLSLDRTLSFRRIEGVLRGVRLRQRDRKGIIGQL